MYLKLCSIFPLLITLSLIAYIYVAYIFTFVVPSLGDDPMNIQDTRNHKGFIYFAAFHLLLFLMVYSFYRTASTDPDISISKYFQLEMRRELSRYAGTDLDEEQPTIENPALIAAFMNVHNLRFCRFCQLFKPPRSHHCSSCNQCILRMDHHCPWVNNCIGYHNYKHFFVLILYSSLILCFVVATYQEEYFTAIGDPRISDFRLFFVILTFLLSATVGLILLALTIFHVCDSLISNSKTTLEYMERRTTTSYDQGCCNNWISTFGINPITWILPNDANVIGDGTQY